MFYCIYTTQYQPAVKRNETRKSEDKWTEQETIILSEVTQTNAYVLLFIDVLGTYVPVLLSFRHVYIDGITTEGKLVPGWNQGIYQGNADIML